MVNHFKNLNFVNAYEHKIIKNSSISRISLKISFILIRFYFFKIIMSQSFQKLYELENIY